MPIFIAALLFIVGIVLIIKGGDYFVDSSATIAEATGIPKFIIGATIVSLATTLPELIVSVLAAIEGKVDMAIGNAVGSVTANTGLILAISLICIPMIMKKKQFAAKGIMLITAILALLLFSLDGALSAVESIFFFALFAFFVFENVREAKKVMKLEAASGEEKIVLTKKQWSKNILFFVIGAVGIVIGSRLLVDNGSLLATAIGIPENIIALTMIAIGTSLPELVTAIIAISKKESSLSIGNILGANIIDTALILPICALISGGSLPVAPQVIFLDLPISLLVIGIILVPAFINGKFTKAQGFTAISVYVTYLATICFFNPFI